MTATIDSDRVVVHVMKQELEALQNSIQERDKYIAELQLRIAALEELNAGYTDAICKRDATIARLKDERDANRLDQ